MANDFSTDSSCKALWRLEDGALTTDSKGTNTLTASASPPVADTSDFKEGAACADFERDSHQYLYIADGDLDAGFPLKTGDTTKKITVCAWVKPESSGSWRRIWSKFDYWGNKRCLDCCINNGTLYIEVGSGTGSGYQSFNTSIGIANAEWYHVAVVVDGVAKTLLVRVYRVSNGTVYPYSNNLSYELYVGDVPFVIGADGAFSTESQFDGKIDEVVVFNRLLSTDEIDAIRNGTYTGPMPQIQADALGALAAYQTDGRVQADALGALVAYSLEPEASFVQADALGVTAAYAVARPPARVFPVPHPKTRWQSRSGKRKFPVVG